MLMNCWARAPGLEKNDAAATATAIIFAFMRIILPLFLAGKLNGSRVAVKLSKRRTRGANTHYSALACRRAGLPELAGCSPCSGRAESRAGGYVAMGNPE